MKFVLNKCYGGFGLSDEALNFMKVKNYWDINRSDEKLIEAVDLLGVKANTSFSKLEIVEVPSNATDYRIIEYDGFETIYYVVDGKINQV